MQKTLKFKNELGEMILAGKKDVTWRIFDDKDLKVGDELILINKDTGENFGNAIIESVREREFRDITESDYIGHEKYDSIEEMLKTYQGYYGDKVNWDTTIKIIKFKLIS